MVGEEEDTETSTFIMVFELRFKSKEIQLHGLSLPGFVGVRRQSLSRACLAPVYVEKRLAWLYIHIIINLCLMGFEKHLVLQVFSLGRGQSRRATQSIFTEWFPG